MLTDRQEKFLKQIQTLTLPASPATWERATLEEAKGKIQDGWDFKWSINSLTLELKRRSENERRQMNTKVQKLYDNLVEAYGEPVPEENIYPTQRPKDWRVSDTDFVYTGSGRLSGWGERNGDGIPVWKAVLVWVFVAINFFVFLFTPFLTWFQNKVGKTIFWIVLVIYALTLIVWMIRAGQLKRKK